MDERVFVNRSGEEGGTIVFDVAVEDEAGTIAYTVKVTPQEYGKLARAGTSPEELVQESFAFLLKREPKESIMRSFSLSDISFYFPEYDDEMTGENSQSDAS